MTTGKKRKGRPPTGRTTIVARVPSDTNVAMAVYMYHDWLPKILAAAHDAKGKEHSPRYDRLLKLLDDLGVEA